jgi:hypothetical protein
MQLSFFASALPTNPLVDYCRYSPDRYAILIGKGTSAASGRSCSSVTRRAHDRQVIKSDGRPSQDPIAFVP